MQIETQRFTFSERLYAAQKEQIELRARGDAESLLHAVRYRSLHLRCSVTECNNSGHSMTPFFDNPHWILVRTAWYLTDSRLDGVATTRFALHSHNPSQMYERISSSNRLRL